MPVVAIATGRPVVLAEIQHALAHGNFTTVDTSAGMELLRLVFELRPQAVILDSSLPDIDWLELLRILRAATDLPIIVLIEEPDPELTARALDVGADDVAQHDTAPSELVARVRAALRRSERAPAAQTETLLIRTGAIEIDRNTKQVLKDGEPIYLTRTEHRLLDALATRAGQMAPHRFLLNAVWGDAYTEDTHYLRVYIGYLRAKLEDDPTSPRYLVNEWGLGYRLAILPPVAPGGEPDPAAGSDEQTSPSRRRQTAGGRGRRRPRASEP